MEDKVLMVTESELPGVLLLDYDAKEDLRGTKRGSFSERELRGRGIHFHCVEETIYRASRKGTLYGIHFQNNPRPQAKVIYCIRGGGRDFAVDLRRGSETYMKWAEFELSSETRTQVYIPRGFGHAFLSVEDDTELVFRVDEYFDPNLSRAVSYLDGSIGIPFGVVNPVASIQDLEAPLLADSDCNL